MSPNAAVEDPRRGVTSLCTSGIGTTGIVRRLVDRYPSAIALAKALRAAQPVGADAIERYQPLPEPSREGRDPLLPSIDRWGQFGTQRGTRR